MPRVIPILMLLTFGVVVCSQTGPATAPVDGEVSYKGKPVPFVKVTFIPRNDASGNIGIAQTGADGKFAKVVTAGLTGNGAVVGAHNVTVTESWPPDKSIPVDEMGQQKSPPRGPWPQKYRDSANPALQVEIVAGQNNHFEFDLSK